MKKTIRAACACLAILFLFSSCLPRSAAPKCATSEDFCVGLVTQVGKIDDNSLNQLAWEGAKKAELKLDAYVQYIETVDSRDYEKNIATFANASYDVIITVGYAQKQPSINAAMRYPQINFIGVDQPLGLDKSVPQNLTGLSFSEDQMGFLAGALAAQMTKTRKVGAVCGPDSFPPAWRYCEGFRAGVGYINSPPMPKDESTETPTGTPEGGPTEEPTQAALILRRSLLALAQRPQEQETPTAGPSSEPSPDTTPVEAVVAYHNEIAFNESLADPEWDALMASGMIDTGVDVIFGADSYGENGAVSMAAKRRVYAIGVNIDQYFTLSDAQPMLLSSAVKEIAEGVFDLLKAAKYGSFPGGDFPGKASYAPYHDLGGHVPDSVTAKLAEIRAGLANGTIETGILSTKP